ncbi:MAG TPA: DUF4142 domain-containing protein [Edaphocola sp.]|nr:DUF4142 domain-containing protein [Edaphocola sp.]
MKNYAKLPFAIFLAFFATVTVAIAQSNNLKDETFVKKAQLGGNKEVRLGQLASEKAVAREVKEYGEMMIKDHQEANAELTRMVQQRNYQPVNDADKDADKAFDKLSRYSADDFDEAYMKAMVKDHEKVVALFEKEAENGNDPEIRQWAKEKLPVLQQHLSDAKNVLSALKSKK